ncbi:S1C family serine protease [Luteolibacter soli]|uniref:PDZ domain-containing protein n=1 Tax=Luteolibacter soli TaxID=3135280 RepID=A0ABU9ARZ3_9BACT
MKSHLAYGFATLLGVASSALAIEPPSTPAPIPPQASPEEAAAPQEVEQARQRVIPQDEPEVEVAPAPAPAANRAYLGVGGSQVPELLSEHLKLQPGHGVVVRALDPAGPAAKAGLVQNDVITKVNGNAVGSQEALAQTVSSMKPGDEVDVDFIHQGEAKTAKIALAVAPAQARAIAGNELKPLERLMLDGMPQDQAQRIQDAIQQNLRAFEDLDKEADALPGRMFGDAMRKRMEQMMQGMEQQAAPQGQGGINLKSSGTIRMLNADGSGVEVMSENGGKQVRVLGKNGKVEWQGPYDTPQDREAVPKDVRERIDNLNIDMDFKGQGLRLRMAPRFQPLEEGQ